MLTTYPSDISQRSTWVYILLSLPYFFSACDTSFSPSSNESRLIQPEQVTEWLPVVNGSDWSLTPTEIDPYHSYAIDRTPCLKTAFGEEYGGVEVSTQTCNYITLQQALRHHLYKGQLLEISFWHGLLIHSQSAEAVITLMIDGQELWSKLLPIPSPPQTWIDYVHLPRDVSAGSLIYLHIRNHGTNSYTLHRLSIGQR